MSERPAVSGPMLVSIAPDGRSRRQLVLAPKLGSPVAAPSGDRVAFLRGGELVVARTDGTHQRVLPHPRHVVVLEFRRPGYALAAPRLAWSPDGLTLAAVTSNARDFQLRLLAVRGGRAHVLVRLARTPSRPFWSADGKRVAVTARGVLVVCVVATGSCTKSRGPGAFSDGAWSSRGELALTSKRGARAGVVVATPTGRVLRAIGVRGTLPSWSPDGRSISFASRSAVFVATRPTFRSRVVFHGETERIPPLWSHDAKTVVVLSRGDLFSARIDGRGTARLTHEGPARVVRAGPTVTRDGRVIYVTEPNGGPNLFSIGSDGTGLRAVTTDGAGYDAPKVSPDGSKVAFLRRNTLYTMPAPAGRARRVAPATSYDWAPDSRRLVVSSNDDIGIVDAGRLQRLTTGPAGDYEPTWSPDGRTIVFRRSVRDRELVNELYAIAADGTHLRAVTHERELSADCPRQTNTPVAPSFSPDGEALAFVEEQTGCESVKGTGALVRVDVDGSDRRVLDDSFHGVNDWGVESVEWSPDGSQLVYEAGTEERVPGPLEIDQRQHLYVIGADRRNRIQLRVDGNARSPTWVPTP